MASSSATAEVPKNRSRATSNASSGMDSDTGRLLISSLGSVVKSSSTTAEVPKNRLRATSNASSAMDSDTGRLLNSLGSVGSSLPDVGPALPPALPDLPKPDDDENEFQVPASVPQHQMKLSDESSLHVSFTRTQEGEHASLTSSRSSRQIPERRLPTKKRKMSYESYDSAMGDSYLGLASLDSGMLPKLQNDLGSVNTKGSGASSSNQLAGLKISAQDHLDALEGAEDGAELPAPAPVARIRKMSEGGGEHGFRDPTVGLAGGGTTDDNSEATFTSSGHRLLMEAIMMTGGLEGGGSSTGARRNRLESWGGMSDLSVHMGPDQGAAAAAIAASALHHTGIIDDVTAAANFGGGSVASSVTDDQLLKPGGTAEGVPAGRERKNSTTSFSDSTFPVPSSLDGLEIPNDLQKFVAAAVASVGDQLAELAGNIESAAAAVDVDNTGKDDDTRHGSEVSSIATPLIVGPALDDPSKATPASQSKSDGDIRKSNKSTEAAAAASAAISVDYDAVAAAVDAANAATGGLDLSAIIGEGSVDLPGMSTTSSASSAGGKKTKAKRKRKLPTHNRTATSHLKFLGDVPKSSLSEKEQKEIRERARKAAGYVPPADLPNGVAVTPTKNGNQPPLKKRMKKMTPESVGSKINSTATPKISNTSKAAETQAAALPVAAKPPKPPGTKVTKEKSTAKWDSMYDALIQFIADRKEEETTGQSEEDIAEWVWDGNVPTTYKTKDGKALGRWINNQRSAKSKGTLREERENRLVGAGLKWSVLASNSWNEMLDELRLYIKEFTKDGKKWDGNVPTNYRIKAKANGKKMSEEDKNLGRWVNRQRSLYQAGKLREDRQLALEKVGLKWSMLATTSWEAMFETLVAYVEDKKKKGIKWDGNVPANYKTDDNPPRALGRWINRQRSAHVKKKLKQEYVEKLSKLGLKWSVHERKYIDDSLISPPAKAQGVASSLVSSSQQAKIPSTIAVPAKKVDPTHPTGQTSTSTTITKPTKPPSVRFDESVKKPLPTDGVGPGNSKPASASATPTHVKSAPAAATASATPKLTATPNVAGSVATATQATTPARTTVARPTTAIKPAAPSATAKRALPHAAAPTSAAIPAQKQATSNGTGKIKTSLQQQAVPCSGHPKAGKQHSVEKEDSKAVLPPSSASKEQRLSTGTPTPVSGMPQVKAASVTSASMVVNKPADSSNASMGQASMAPCEKQSAPGEDCKPVKKEPTKPTLLPPASAGTRKPMSMGELVKAARTASTTTTNQATITVQKPVKREAVPAPASAATKKPVSMGELVKAARIASTTSAPTTMAKKSEASGKTVATAQAVSAGGDPKNPTDTATTGKAAATAAPRAGAPATSCSHTSWPGTAGPAVGATSAGMSNVQKSVNVKKETSSPTSSPSTSGATSGPSAPGNVDTQKLIKKEPGNPGPTTTRSPLPSKPTSSCETAGSTSGGTSAGIVKAPKLVKEESSKAGSADTNAAPPVSNPTSSSATAGPTSVATSAGMVNTQKLVKEEPSKVGSPYTVGAPATAGPTSSRATCPTGGAPSAARVSAKLVKKEPSQPRPTDAAARKEVSTPELLKLPLASTEVRSQAAAIAEEVTKPTDSNASSGAKTKESPRTPNGQLRTTQSSGEARGVNSGETAGKKAASPTPTATAKYESESNACQSDVPLLEKETEKGVGDKVTSGEPEKKPSKVA